MQEAVELGDVKFYKVAGLANPSNMLTKIVKSPEFKASRFYYMGV